MKTQIFLVMAAVAMMARPALAQPQTSVEVTKGAGTATVTGTAKVTATVVEIDPATRTVTLKDKKGHIVDVEVGEEARNFDQLKVGDVVTTEYREAMSLSLSKTSGPRSASERTMEQRSSPGAKPGGTIGREITVMADVRRRECESQNGHIKGTARQHGGCDRGGPRADEEYSQGRSGSSRVHGGGRDIRHAQHEQVTDR